MRRTGNNNEKSFFAENAELPVLASSLDNIYKKVDKEGLGEQTALDLEKDIKAVSDRFGISPKAAVLLAAVLEFNARNGSDDDDLSAYIGCSNIEFIGFRGALRELEDKSIISRRSGRGNRYMVGREALKAIEKDTEFVPLSRTGLTADELFTRFRIVFSDFQADRIDVDRLLEELMQLIEGNPQLEFCRKAGEALSSHSFCDSEKRFFLALCHRYVSHGNTSATIDYLLRFTDFMEDEQFIRRSIAHKRSTLQHSGLVTKRR